jgi:hypothetical protein
MAKFSMGRGEYDVNCEVIRAVCCGVAAADCAVLVARMTTGEMSRVKTLHVVRNIFRAEFLIFSRAADSVSPSAFNLFHSGTRGSDRDCCGCEREQRFTAAAACKMRFQRFYAALIFSANVQSLQSANSTLVLSATISPPPCISTTSPPPASASCCLSTPLTSQEKEGQMFLEVRHVAARCGNAPQHISLPSALVYPLHSNSA